LITFYVHNGYRSVGEHRMHNIRSVPLALQFVDGENPST
jgi:hypothetical protein